MDVKSQGWWVAARRCADYGSLISSMLFVFAWAFDTAGWGLAADLALAAPLFAGMILNVVMAGSANLLSIKINDRIVDFHATKLGEGEAEKIVKAIRGDEDSRRVHHRELA